MPKDFGSLDWTEQVKICSKVAVTQQMGELALGMRSHLDLQGMVLSAATATLNARLNLKLNGSLGRIGQTVTNAATGAALGGMLTGHMMNLEQMEAQMLGSQIGSELGSELTEMMVSYVPWRTMGVDRLERFQTQQQAAMRHYAEPIAAGATGSAAERSPAAAISDDPRLAEARKWARVRLDGSVTLDTKDSHLAEYAGDRYFDGGRSATVAAQRGAVRAQQWNREAQARPTWMDRAAMAGRATLDTLNAAGKSRVVTEINHFADLTRPYLAPVFKDALGTAGMMVGFGGILSDGIALESSALRQRVFANIAESRTAREKSFFEIHPLVEKISLGGLDVRTGVNQAVFWSGPGNRALAETYAVATDKTILEFTPGGRYLESLDLFNNFPRKQALVPWERLSEQFAKNAFGRVSVFAEGARLGGIFNQIELPILRLNPNITEIVLSPEYRYTYSFRR